MQIAIAAITAGVSAHVANKGRKQTKHLNNLAMQGADADRAKGQQLRDIASLESNRVRREEAQTSTLVAAAQNQRVRPAFLSKAGFGGLRNRLGGARVAA